MSNNDTNVEPKKHVGVSRLLCIPCGFGTSGISLPEKADGERFCPRCNAQLVWCPACKKYLSAHEENNLLTCDTCKKPIPERDRIINKGGAEEI